MIREKKIAVLILFLCCFGRAFSQNDSIFNNKTLSSFKLYNTGANKNIYLPQQAADKRFSLFIFLSPECPLCKSYLTLLNNLQENYKTEIAFYGIVPGKAYSAKLIKQFASEYKVEFPLLIDSLRLLTKYLHARVTPQVVLLNKDVTLVYNGAIDDLLMGLGKRRIKVTNEYLKDAIVQSLENKTVAIKRTKAVGCKINDY